MFNLLYLLPVLPSLLVATLLFRFLLKKYREAEEGLVPATVDRRQRAARRLD